ncbi:MAG: cupin domain-containing protein [Chloroflexi bacterium]|jgi:mannose-6-phosphate isomerase-like protein (cupin superfamily)|nr:cupin domain-containing protein [Chloroflexota bacterium]MBT7080760.1 cupin domain-containing protein [Chloroflexota bacterium]MBT7290157.1 cupin domain-containing protein [Chloroflexota bacterium]
MEIVNRDDVVPFITKDTSIVREILSPANSLLFNQSLAEAIVQKGKATAEHYHMQSEEIYYITAGKGLMKISDEIKEVRVGDAIVIEPGIKHKIWNTANSDLVFLCCCAPPYDHDDTVVVE